MGEFDVRTVLIAFGLTLFAGLSTGIGSALAFFARRTNTRFLCVSLGFSAGVMIYVSFTEILVKATDALTAVHGEVRGTVYAVLSFFGGLFLVALIDRLVPNFENPHEVHLAGDMDDLEETARFRSLYRMGMLSALALPSITFPKGLQPSPPP